MLYKVLLILSHVSMISSSLVVDSSAQRSIYVADYCPKMHYCSNGAHVMCMYYNAKKKMGPQCSNAQNISMTPELANKLLDVSNAVRSRIAQGKEKGKNGDLLPRGYGVFRLHWDTELATFAQVLANQCVLRHDLCRATKRFPDPGQTAGLVRFSYPDWFPVSKSGNFTTPGISTAKLMYAVTQVLKSWYGQKNSVTPSMITFYPDWTLNPNSQSGRLYMDMIYGSATHMGCGISAYTEYAFYDNNAALNYNSVQIICNYSARPRKGTAVYNTVPPGDTAEPFSRCGCPVGSEPDDECLCHESKRQPLPIEPLKLESRRCPSGQVCDPTVVVLPIFTVEDAPPEKLFTHESFANMSVRKHLDDSLFQRSESNLFHKRNFYAADEIVAKPQVYGSKGKTQKQSRSQQNIRPTSQHQAKTIRNRYFDKKHIVSKPQGVEQSPRAIRNSPRKKTSLFNRAAKFKLPGTLSIRPMKPAGIKDVVPRKDFSTAKQLVNKYLFQGKGLLKPQYKIKTISDGNEAFDKNKLSNERPVDREATADSKRENIMNDFIHEVKTMFNKHEQTRNVTKNEQRTAKMLNNLIERNHSFHEVFNILNATKPLKLNKEIANYQKIQRPTTETVLNTAKQNVIIQDSFIKQIVSSINDYNKALNSVTVETDNKLMTLLNTLEREVKHVQLREEDKQLFDAKMRKIYGKVVGKPVSILDTNSNFPDDVKKSYVIQKSIQQDPKEEPLHEKFKMKIDGPDELLDRKLESNNMYRSNSTRDRNEIDMYEETNSYKKKRHGLRGMKHSETSYEQMRSRYRDYGNDREYGERKTYRNNDFDINNLEDEPRRRGIDNKYQGRNIQKDRLRDDEVEHRNGNDLQRRGRKNSENLHRNVGIDQTIRNKNYYLSNDAGNDDLSVERRRFYQEKLDNIERRLQMRNQKRRKDKPRHMRPMRPAARKSENQMDIYGRARFAHGY